MKSESTKIFSDNLGVIISRVAIEMSGGGDDEQAMDTGMELIRKIIAKTTKLGVDPRAKTLTVSKRRIVLMAALQVCLLEVIATGPKPQS